MGYTIVYDRKFIRCGDKYIPFCLYGSSNCTFYSYRSGREVRERSWGNFVYKDNMILGTSDEIMSVVKATHTGTSSENFKFHGKWMDDAQVVRFFESGIKNAVTVADLRKACHESIHCYLSSWMYLQGPEMLGQRSLADTENVITMDTYVKTEEELTQWVDAAKKEKARIVTSGDAASVYICISLSTIDPIRAVCRTELSESCVIKDGKHGFVVRCDSRSVSYSNDPDTAKVFTNSDEAYLAIDACSILSGAKLISKAYLDRKKAKAVEQKFVLSVVSPSHGRVYVMKKTRTALHYSYTAAYAKKFSKASDATKWFNMYVKDRFDPAVTDPIVEAC